MSFIKNLLNIRDIKGPEFYKDFEIENKHLYDLEELYSRVKSDKRNIIMRDIINLKAGLEGERSVSYELKNSFIPMICLHDIRIENAGYVAQMDYILIGEYFIMILETKRLNGDIVINESGEFIRKFKNKSGKVIKEEGMYSPVTQNERHVRILDNYLKANGLIKKMPILSTVVIANPKAIINRNKAPYVIKKEIIKYDQVTSTLKKIIDTYKKEEAPKFLESHMIKIANFLIESNKEITYDYNAKYGLINEDFKETISLAEQNIVAKTTKQIESDIHSEKNNDEKLYEKLKEYRYDKAKEDGSKPYIIFSNITLNELVKNKPKNKEELLMVQGFGNVKVEKYGERIIEIIEKFI